MTTPKPIEIRTRYYGPIGLKGSRIIATGGGKRITVGYDHAAQDPHEVAAKALLDKLGYNVLTYITTRDDGGKTYRAEY